MPEPEPKAGHAAIEVKAFGLNHAELHMRKKGVGPDRRRQRHQRCRHREILPWWRVSDRHRWPPRRAGWYLVAQEDRMIIHENQRFDGPEVEGSATRSSRRSRTDCDRTGRRRGHHPRGDSK